MVATLTEKMLLLIVPGIVYDLMNLRIFNMNLPYLISLAGL